MIYDSSQVSFIEIQILVKIRANTSGALDSGGHEEIFGPRMTWTGRSPSARARARRRASGTAGRFAQRVGNASVSVPELGSLAYLHYGRPLGRLPVRGRARLVVVIGGTRHPDGLQERGERIFPPQRLHYLVLPPAAERAVAEAAIRFKVSASISRRAHRCSSLSSLAGSFRLRPGGWTARASSPPSRYRFIRSRICALLRTSCSRARAL